MNWSDLTNGIFELTAALFLSMSCLKLFRDKEVKGWSITTQLFFTSWTYWNLFFYPHLHQWFSLCGGFFVMITNTTWTAMAIYYTRKNKKKQLLKG